MALSRHLHAREKEITFAENTRLQYLDIEIVRDGDSGEKRNIVAQGHLLDGDLESWLMKVLSLHESFRTPTNLDRTPARRAMIPSWMAMLRHLEHLMVFCELCSPALLNAVDNRFTDTVPDMEVVPLEKK